jgi:predicted DNA-binding transcriptional regulator AlpA
VGRFLTKQEVCELIKVDERTLERYVSTGFFPRPSLRLPGKVRWRKAVVDAWLDRKEREELAGAK